MEAFNVAFLTSLAVVSFTSFPPAVTAFVHTGTQTFTYYAEGRLTEAVGSYGTLTYAYDPLGNMVGKEGMPMAYGLPIRVRPMEAHARHAA